MFKNVFFCPILFIALFSFISNGYAMLNSETLMDLKTKDAVFLEHIIVDEVDLQAIATALRENKILTKLNLRGNKIGDVGAKMIAATLMENRTLITLILKWNEINTAGAVAIAAALKENKTLTTLNLTDNNIGTAGAEALAVALSKNHTLTTLNLWHSYIGATGALAIVTALKENNTLNTLIIGMNQLSEVEAQAIAAVLRENSNLTTLDLTANQIGDAGAQAIAAALKKNRTLTTLYLGNNQISDVGAKAIAAALMENQTLTTLDLTDNQISDAAAKKINRLLIDNYSLLEIDDNKDKKTCLRNSLLTQLLRKLKRATTFISVIKLRSILPYLLKEILNLAALNTQNRTTFANVQDYNTEAIRQIIFGGSREEIIKLFYYGNSYTHYDEIIREVNRIRQLQREIWQEINRPIPEGWLLPLPETIDVALTPPQVAAVFWAS